MDLDNSAASNRGNSPRARRLPLAGLLLAAALGAAPCGVFAADPASLKAPSLDPHDLSGVWWSQANDDAAHPIGGPIAFTPAGRKTYAATVAGLKSGDVDDPARSRCLLPGAVRTMAAPYPIQILQIPGEVVLLPEAWHAYREVFMDTPHTDADDINPSFMGESVGHWDGDTLVVDTIGVKDGVWLDGTGLPRSDQLHIVEHIRKFDGGKRLEDRITITDPKIYARSWTVRHVYEWRPDVHLMEYVCTDRNRDISAATRLPKLPPAVAQRPAAPAVPPGAVDLSGVWHRLGRGGGGGFRNMFTTTSDGQNPPLQPWSQAVLDRYRKAIADGHPIPTLATRCMPTGLPAFWSQPYPDRLVQTADYLVVLGEADHQFRIVYMNAQHPTTYDPTWYGNSIGHWEGDTLVVETVGQNDRTLFSAGGIPKTEALVITEHFHLKDPKTLDDRMTIDDPGVFTMPWETGLTLTRMGPNDRLDEYVCAENERDVVRQEAGLRSPATPPGGH